MAIFSFKLVYKY